MSEREDLSLDQRVLYDVMTDISEAHYCAGWMHKLEFDLWLILKGGPRHYGMGAVTDTELSDLRTASERAGGWIIWDDGPKFVTLNEWAKLASG